MFVLYFIEIGMKCNKYNFFFDAPQKRHKKISNPNPKTQAVARPDNSGIPKQDIEFKFNINIKTDAAELPFAIMIEWFGTTSDKM